MQGRRRKRRVGIDGSIETRLELGGKLIEGRPLGAARAARRHHAGADLLDDLLPGLGTGSDARDVQGVERETGSLRPLVVAGDAVLIEKRGFGRAALAPPAAAGRRADGTAVRAMSATSTAPRMPAERLNGTLVRLKPDTDDVVSSLLPRGRSRPSAA